MDEQKKQAAEAVAELLEEYDYAGEKAPDGKDRLFVSILYPDAEDYSCEEVLAKYQEYARDWAYILHDRDTDKEEKPKKPHYHVCIRLKNSVTCQTVANKVGIRPNYIRRMEKPWQTNLQYLIHFKDDSKAQYDVKEVVCNFAFDKEAKVKTEESRVGEIMHYLLMNECTSMTELSGFCLHQGLWGDLRRGYPIFNAIMNENRIRKGEQNDS